MKKYLTFIFVLNAMLLCGITAHSEYFRYDFYIGKKSGVKGPITISGDTIICQGDAATITASGDTTYQWADVANPSVIISTDSFLTVTPASTNAYIVYGEDDTVMVTVTVNLKPIINIPDSSICPGNTITLDAGNPGSTYIWSTTETTQTINVNAAGTYYVSVTDANGCKNSDSSVVTLKPVPTKNLTDNAFCNSGSATLDAGNAGSTYLWSTGANTQTISVNIQGQYIVTVTNAAGCNIIDTANVLQLDSLPVYLSDTSLCQGQSAVLNPGYNGATFQWSTGVTTQTITVSTTGNYSVTVSGNGCTGRDTAHVTVHPNPVVSLSDSSICPGDIVQLDAGNPGANYQWSTAANTQTINANAAGTYTVTVTDNFGCKDSSTSIISQKPTPVKNLNNQIICPGNSATLDAGNPGATYNWSTGAQTQTINVNTAGTYIVTVSIPNGCTITDTSVVTQLQNIPVNLHDTTMCQGQTITLDAGNTGAQYNWSTGDTTQTITVGTTGTYYVTVSQNGCTGGDTSNVTVNPKPVVNLQDAVICPGQSVTLDAGNPGSTYQWSTTANTQTISVNTAGTYSVTVTNSNSCTESDTAVVTQSQKPQINLSNQTICQGKTATLDVGNPGSHYSWSTGDTTQTYTTGNAGTYYVTVTNSSGCTNSDTATVTVKPKPTVTLTNGAICPGDPYTLDAGNPGSTYQWSTTQTTQTITVHMPGSYSVTVINSNGCRDSTTANVTQKPTPVDNLNDESICGNTPATLDADNTGSTYLWSTGANTQTITVNTPGTYSVTITNSNGCKDTAYANVTQHQPPQVNINDQTICEGQAAVLDADNAGSTYQWSNGANTQVVNATMSGSYTVTVTDANGCSASDNAVVTVKPKPQVDLSPGNLCNGPVTFNAGNSGATYQWSTGETTQSITVNAAGIYSVVVQKNGCSGGDTTAVTECPYSADVPSGFSPNGDGHNDILYVRGSGIDEFVFMVFNRNGVMVFTTNELTKGWDGRYFGIKQESDVYVYHLIGKFSNGEKFFKKGSVTLLN